MAKVLIEYEGNVDGLKATLSEVAAANEQISDSAKKSSAEVAAEYKKVAAAGKAAFASEETKKALDSQVASVNTLKTQLEKLYAEEVQLLSSGKQLTDQYKKNREEAARVRGEFDKLTSAENEQIKTEEKQVVVTKKLTTQLRDLKQQLSLLEDEGKATTKEFEQIAIAAAKLEDQIGDTQERVKSLASDTFVFDAAIDSVSALAGGFAVAEGAVGLFADGNEELQQAIAKTNSALAILNGLQQIQAFVTGQSAGKLALINIAQKAYNVLSGQAVVLTRGFTLALAATGIGAFAIALGGLIFLFDSLNQSVGRNAPLLAAASDRLKELQKEAEDATLRLKVLRGEITNTDAQRLKAQASFKDQLAKDLIPLLAEQSRLEKDIILNKKTIATLEEIGDTAGVQRLRERIVLQEQEQRQNQEAIDTLIASSRERLVQDLQIIGLENKKEEQSKKTTKTIIEEAKAYESLTLNVKDLNAELSRSFGVQIDEALQAELATREATLLRTRDLLLEELATEEDVKRAETRVILTEQKIQIQAIEDSAKQKLESAKGNANEIVSIEVNKTAQIELVNQQTTSKILALDEKKIESAKNVEEQTKKSNDEQINKILAYANTVGSILNSIGDLERDLTERRINNIEEVGNAEIEAINKAQISEADRLRQREASELRTNRRIAQEKRKQARLDKALGIFNAVVSTAESIVKTGAQLGYPQAIPFQIIAGVIGAANVAKIASEPLPKFRKGGWINGASHEGGGVHIEAEGGEYVTRRGVASQHRTELEAMNKSKAAFMKVIEDRYVRPRLMAAMMDKKDRSMNVNVNASLRSEKMESEIVALRRETRNTGKVISKALTSGTSSRYHWS